MTFAEWESLALQTAAWIREAEERGDTAEADRLRTEIWALYATIDRDTTRERST